MKEYKVPVITGMTILETLFYIKEKLDGSLSYRCSCRMGICGSCGMMVNGKPFLTCHTQVMELESDFLTVKPLPNYPVVKDLVTDFSPLFVNHKSIKPYILGNEAEQQDLEKEYLQSPEELEEYLQFSYCLKCGLCLSACPTAATDHQFPGPQALAQVYRYLADNRDNGDERMDLVDHPHGVWRCHLAGACSQACPKGVDPALAIQLLKRKTGFRFLGFGKNGERAKKAGSQKDAERRPDIPDAPAPTVG